MIRWRQLSLRARLTLIAAVAVAAAVLLVSATAWLLIRRTLRDQVDTELRVAAAGGIGKLNPRALLRPMPPRQGFSELLDNDPLLSQIVLPNGEVVGLASSAARVPVTEDDIAVASGAKDTSWRDVDLASGHYRVLTVQGRGGSAIQLFTSLDPVDRTLSQLAVLLGLVSVAGVAGAAVLGRTVARAGLAPVDRLTAAAEHVAQTQDLQAAIEVQGDDELARLARSFNEMLGALDRARAAQRQLVEDASHELRTPLTSLRTNIELLLRAEVQGEERLPPDDRRLLLADLRRQMGELTHLINELVELAREEGPAEPVERLDLADIVGGAVERARVRSPRLTVHAELDSAPVAGRAAVLERAILNLLDNAAKWSPPGEVVEVTLEHGGRWTVLTVADRGPGIDEADRPRVFERFYRAPAARAMPGSGLGLAIVRQAMESHGGQVRAEGRPGGGAVLRARLPVASERSGPSRRDTAGQSQALDVIEQSGWMLSSNRR
jgi:two-component system, OmpR family, sensor histidine kinase MprB